MTFAVRPATARTGRVHRHRRQRALPGLLRRRPSWRRARRSSSRPSCTTARATSTSDTGDRRRRRRRSRPVGGGTPDYAGRPLPATGRQLRRLGPAHFWGDIDQIGRTGPNPDAVHRRGRLRPRSPGSSCTPDASRTSASSSTTATPRTPDSRPVRQPARRPRRSGSSRATPTVYTVAGRRPGLRRPSTTTGRTATTPAGACTCGATRSPTAWAPTGPRPGRPTASTTSAPTGTCRSSRRRRKPRQLHHPQGRRPRTPAPTSSFIPADQPAVVAQVRATPTIHAQPRRGRGLRDHPLPPPRRRLRRLVVANFHDFWGMHVWTGSAETGTEWTSPLQAGAASTASARCSRCRSSTDATQLELHPPPRRHQGSRPPTSSSTSLEVGNEVWYLSGHADADQMPVPAARSQAGGGRDADLTKQQAHWVDRGHHRLERRADPGG